MGILNDLVSVSEEFASQAWQRALDQRHALELLGLRGDAEAVSRAQMALLTLERAYWVALYRLNADRAVSGSS